MIVDELGRILFLFFKKVLFNQLLPITDVPLSDAATEKKV